MTAKHKTAWIVSVLAGAVVVTLAGCATAEAIEKLPEGYWMATERLVVAIISDLWSLVSWLI